MGIKNTMAWPMTIAATLLMVQDTTLGFAPHSTSSTGIRSNVNVRFNSVNVARISRIETANGMVSSTVSDAMREHADTVRGSPDVAVATATSPEVTKLKETSTEALERLLSRQESEIEETKRLLQLYKYAEDVDRVQGPLTADQAPVELLSVASSILKGFDYGFESRSEGGSVKNLNGGMAGYGPPSNLVSLGIEQFMRNLRAMVGEYQDEVDVELTSKQVQVREKLEKLTLSSKAIWERELKDGPIEAPLAIKVPYLFLCYMLDTVFENKYVPSRFFLLETVARMPYFSYITMLHLYETLGFWRRSSDIKRIHFAEEINEYHHLMIMESLGGDQPYWVRFLAQHSAIAYYIGLCSLWAVSPSLSYKFSELLETHAVNTYGQFLDENEELLKDLPPSMAALDYYALSGSDPYYAEFQTTAMNENKEIRRPGNDMKTLYDVFTAIHADEGDHVSTMEACMDESVAKLSPSLERKVLTAAAATIAIAMFLNTGAESGVGSDIVNTIDFAADETVASGLVDAAVVGMTGAFAQMGLNAEEGMIEEGTLLSLRTFGVEITRILARML